MHLSITLARQDGACCVQRSVHICLLDHKFLTKAKQERPALFLQNAIDSTKNKQKQLDDGWPASAEEQVTLVLLELVHKRTVVNVLIVIQLMNRKR